MFRPLHHQNQIIRNDQQAQHKNIAGSDGKHCLTTTPDSKATVPCTQNQHTMSYTHARTCDSNAMEVRTSTSTSSRCTTTFPSTRGIRSTCCAATSEGGVLSILHRAQAICANSCGDTVTFWLKARVHRKCLSKFTTILYGSRAWWPRPLGSVSS